MRRRAIFWFAYLAGISTVLVMLWLGQHHTWWRSAFGLVVVVALAFYLRKLRRQDEDEDGWNSLHHR